jgi:YegS/Rv2252/BmrU family lipid kinase
VRRVALIYNPASGQHAVRPHAAVDEALAVLRRAGVDAVAFETEAPGDATVKVRLAVERGYDTVLACGGDGTVLEVLQGVVGTAVALGVVPLGTANALAADLGLQGSPARAVRKLLGAKPVRISVGKIEYESGTGERQARYFTVTAGVGPDALFIGRLDPELKRRWGYVLYLIEGFRVWVTHTFPLFEVQVWEPGAREPRRIEASQLLAVRIRDFGGVLRNLAPGAGLHKNGLRLVVFKTRKRLHYFRYVMASIFGKPQSSERVELTDAVAVECRARKGSRVTIQAEADGEPLGELPVRIEIVPDAVSLLIPDGARP